MTATTGFSPRGYVEIVQRRWKILAVAAVIGLVGAIVAGGLTTPEYTAQARVLVRAIVADPFQPNIRLGDTIDLASEIELVSSTSVILAAAEELGIEEPNVTDIASRLDVSAVGTSQVLRITYTAASPERARDWAGALANAYLAQREARADELVDALVAALNAQISELEGVVGPDGQRSTVTEARLVELSRQRSALLSLVTTPGELLRPPQLPQDQSGAPPWVGQLGAMSLALLAGFGVALAVDRADDRARTTTELDAVAGPILGVLDTPGSQTHGTGGLGVRSSAASDAVRIVKLRLNRSSTRPLRRVVITSPTAGPPTLDVGMQIATDLAGDGTRIVLIGTGVRDRLDIMQPSLEDVLDGQADLDKAVVAAGPEQPNLFLVEVGTEPWRASSATRLDGVLRELASQFWAFVVVVPPVLESGAPGLELAVASDAVLMVVDESGADVGQLTRAVDSVRSVGANFAGTVVARSSPVRRFFR